MKQTKITGAICTFMFIFIGGISNLHAQNNDSVSYARQLRLKLSLLDKTKAYTGYLYDQAPVSIPPNLYSGLDVDTVRPDAYDFRTLIRQHQAAYINDPNNTDLYKKLDSINNYYQSQGVIPVNVLHFAYDKLRYDAIDNGYLQYNNSTDSQLIIGPDITHSPFVGFNVFASAPWYGSYSGLNVKFIFPSSLFISNLHNPVTKMEFKTEGTDWITVSENQPIEVSYESSGMKWGSLRISVQIDNENIIMLASGFKFYVNTAWSIVQPDEHVDISASISLHSPALPFTEICEASSDYNSYGSLRYYVKYANQDHMIHKPFIFVEGIDFDYKDYHITQGNWRYGEFGWDVFSSGGGYPNGFPDFDKKGKPYSKGLDLLSGSNGLITQLISLGYDVILVDFERGADYIQKNSFALVKAIEDINYRKSLSGSTEENVIIGASMGGLVVRYALAYMEKHNLPHCTRLYVSFDAPHLGANIPIGLQYGLLFSAGTGNSDDATEYVRRLNLPAAKQMLLRHMSKTMINLDEVESYAPCYRNNWNNALTDIGWPENLRKIAISNGSISGIGDGISNGDQLVDWVYNSWTDLYIGSFTFLAGKTNVYAQGRSDNLVFTGVCTKEKQTFSPCFTLLPGIWVDEIPGGNIAIKFGSALGCLQLNIFRYTKNYPFDCGGRNCANLDGAPGGQHDGLTAFSDGIADVASKHSDAPKPTFVSGNGYSTFIPATSSLALTTPPNYNGNYFYNIKANLNSDNTDPAHSHFEAFKGPEYPFPNEGHVFLKDDNWYAKNPTNGITTLSGYKGNTDWLLNQMKMNSYDLTSSIPSSNGNIYNFDRNQRRLGNVTVSSGGTLQVNGNYKTHWGTVNDVAPDPGNTVIVIMPSCRNSTISINNGASLILGENNSLNNKGILDIQSTSTLNLNDGATLTIYDNSKLIIESGATLNISGTPTIALGNNAVIEIQDGGILNIGTGAIFKVTGNGFVRLYGSAGLSSIITGQGSINIIGSSSSNKILELVSSSAGNNITIGYAVTPSTSISLGGIQNITLSNGIIQSSCAINFNAPLTLNNVIFNDAGSTSSNYCANSFIASISTIKSPFFCWGNVTIESSVIANRGNIHAYNILSPNRVTILNTSFNSNLEGLYLYNCNTELSGLTFTDNYLAWRSDAMTTYTSCAVCTVQGSSMYPSSGISKGIVFSGNSLASLYLERVKINNMYDAGIIMEGSDLSAKCGKIKGMNAKVDNSSIILNNNASLTLDPSLLSDAGRMDLSGYVYAVNANNANNIYIQNANSNLYSDQASLNGNITSVLLQLDAESNFWTYDISGPSKQNSFIDFSDPSGQFYDFIQSFHWLNSSNYLTSPPNIDELCPVHVDPCPTCFRKTGNVYSSKIFERADSIPYQNGQSMKHVLKAVFSDDIDTTQAGMEAQLNYHEQVLKHNFGSYKNRAKPVTDLIYARMQQTIGMGVKHGLIQQTSTSSHINKLINLQDTLLNRTAFSDTATRYRLIRDKAMAFRLSNRRTQALTLLNQAHQLAKSSDIQFIEKWQCYLDKEIKLQNGTITTKEFMNSVKQCGIYDTILYAKKSANDIPYITNSQIEEEVSGVTEVSFYPNPAMDNLNIDIKNLSVESAISITIIDVLGKTIYSGSYFATDKNTHFNIPLSIPSGTYFVKLDGNQINEIKRFVVMK